VLPEEVDSVEEEWCSNQLEDSAATTVNILVVVWLQPLLICFIIEFHTKQFLRSLSSSIIYGIRIFHVL